MGVKMDRYIICVLNFNILNVIGVKIDRHISPSVHQYKIGLQFLTC